MASWGESGSPANPTPVVPSSPNDVIHDDRMSLKVRLEPMEAIVPGQSSPLAIFLQSDFAEPVDIAMRIELPPLVRFGGEDVRAFGVASSRVIIPEVIERRSGYTYVKLRDMLIPGEEKLYEVMVVFAAEEAITEIDVRAVRISPTGIPDLRTFAEAFSYFSLAPEVVRPVSIDGLRRLNQATAPKSTGAIPGEALMLVAQPLPGIPINDHVIVVAPDLAKGMKDPFGLPTKRRSSRVALVEPDITDPRAFRSMALGLNDDQPGEEAEDETFLPPASPQPLRPLAPEMDRPRATRPSSQHIYRDAQRRPAPPRSQR